MMSRKNESKVRPRMMSLAEAFGDGGMSNRKSAWLGPQPSLHARRHRAVHVPTACDNVRHSADRCYH